MKLIQSVPNFPPHQFTASALLVRGHFPAPSLSEYLDAQIVVTLHFSGSSVHGVNTVK